MSTSMTGQGSGEPTVGLGNEDVPPPPEDTAPGDDSERIRNGQRPRQRRPAPADVQDNGASPADEAHDRLRDNDAHNH